MATSNRQPQWDIYEAVILLSGYLEAKNGNEPKSHVIKRVSTDLRQMAVNKGLDINEVYRNENGISYQIQSMDSAYKGHKVYVPATKLFTEIVNIYKAERKKYIKLLEEASSMNVPKQNKQDAFLVWVTSTLPAPKCKWLEENLLRVEKFANKTNLISGSLFDVLDTATLYSIGRAADKNKFFQIKYHKIINNIREAFNTYIMYCEQMPATTKNENEISTEPTSVPEKNRIPEEAAFFSYLQDTVKLANKTCASYVSSIKSAERYASDNKYASSTLFGSDCEITESTAKELYADADFVRYNEQQHNRFSAAINKLLKFIGVDIPEKVVATIDNAQSTVQSLDNEAIVKVMKEHYQYGFKLDSIRELMRFRQFADTIGVTFSENDDDLKAAIMASGTVIEDKVFCKSDDLYRELRDIVNEIFASGYEVIYYESLLELKNEWMLEHVIIDEYMLKEYLRKSVPGCSFSKKFMLQGKRRNEKKAVTDEIIRIWGKNQTVTVNDLNERLPYIPLGNIWHVISGNDLFVRISEGKYLYTKRLRITDDEANNIIDYIETTCEEIGFASLSEVPLGDIEEENYEISQLAIRNAIYKKVLSEKYHLNGKILTKGKSELNAVALLKQYIKGKDECSFDEVADKVIELTGGPNRQYAFQALYDDMVRVDRNRFVADKYVNFPVDEIDEILSVFITNHFRAIKDVTTFAVFPVCGHGWNHYLLESFCYKYSKKYSFHVIHFNDKNAGIIAEKEFNKNYNEMLSLALARTEVILESEVIGKYLFDTGYIAKSKYAKLAEIAQRAKELRKERR